MAVVTDLSVSSCKYFKFLRALAVLSVFIFLQACNLAANEINPDPEALSASGICGMRFVRGCDTSTPLYNEASGVQTSNIACKGVTLEATCAELIVDDGEGPYSLWTVSSVTCPSGYESVKLGSPTAVTNLNFTCFKE